MKPSVTSKIKITSHKSFGAPVFSDFLGAKFHHDHNFVFFMFFSTSKGIRLVVGAEYCTSFSNLNCLKSPMKASMW